MKALNRMRVNFSGIEVDSGRMISAIAEEREAYDRLQSVRAWLQENPDEDPVFSLLIRAVTERLEQRLERIFRLVGLIYSPHDIYSVDYNGQIKPALRQSAIEFLDNLLDAGLKQTVIRLLEDNATRPIQFISREAVFGMLMTGEDPWLKAIATEFTSNERSECKPDRAQPLTK